MLGASHDTPMLSLRAPGADCRDLERMANEQSSPDDIQTAVILMRRWTRLPESCRPEVQFRHNNIGSKSTLGFLAWLVDVCGNRVYMRLRVESPIEAAEFRHQALILCATRVDQLSRMGGSGLVKVFSHALAKHAEYLPETMLDDPPITEARRRERETKKGDVAN